MDDVREAAAMTIDADLFARHPPFLAPTRAAIEPRDDETKNPQQPDRGEHLRDKETHRESAGAVEQRGERQRRQQCERGREERPREEDRADDQRLPPRAACAIEPFADERTTEALASALGT